MVSVGQRVVASNGFGDAGTASLDPKPSARIRRTARQDDVAERRELLTHAIRAAVIPRLVMARRQAARTVAPRTPLVAAPAAADIVELAAITMTRDVAPAAAFVESMRIRGASLETLFLDLLAPTARHLGELWEQDLADFGQVTLGLSRLHQVLRGFAPAFQREAAATGRDLRALLAAVPGEQHTFGLAMVVEFFRRGGWIVADDALATTRDLVAAVRGAWFAVVGLSLASEARLEAVAACIRAVRQASRNPAVGVLVGGPVFVAHPELVPLVGADATAVDGRQAVTQAQSLLALLPSHG